MSKYSKAEIAARDAVIQALYDNVPQNTLSELWRHYLGLRNIAEKTEEKPAKSNVDLGVIDFSTYTDDEYPYGYGAAQSVAIGGAAGTDTISFDGISLTL